MLRLTKFNNGDYGTQTDADVFGVLGDVSVKSEALSFVSPLLLEKL